MNDARATSSAEFSRRTAVLNGLALLACAGGGVARAAAFPSRPLNLLVPANPGGGWDQLARLIQHVLSEEKLAPVPVEVLNRGGAGGAIGLAETISRRHGDPHTVMIAGAVMIGATLAQHSPFRITDTAPLARLLIEHLVIAVPYPSPFVDIAQFLEAFRRNPDEISWCGGSAGGVDHILVGLVAEAAGVDPTRLRYVAYSGGGEASAAIMGGQVSAGVAGYSEWRGLAESGRIRLLASASPARFAAQSFPTLRDAGLDVVLQNWRGVFAPPGLSEAQVEWWSTLLARMHESALWQGYIERNGWEDGLLQRAAFGSFVASEQARTARTLERIGITGQGGGYSPVGPWAVPTAIGVAAAAAATATIVESRRRAPGDAVPAAGAEDEDDGGGPVPLWSRFALGAGLSLAYVFGLAWLGFLVATPPFVVGLCVLMRSKALLRDAVVAVALTFCVWWLFGRVLYVQLP